MRKLARLLVLFTCTGPFAAIAQQSQQLEVEHHYEFTVQEDMAPGVEKELTSAIVDLEPRMHVNTDAIANEMKVLAYQPIDPEAVIALAAQFGVTLQAQEVELVPSELEEE